MGTVILIIFALSIIVLIVAKRLEIRKQTDVDNFIKMGNELAEKYIDKSSYLKKQELTFKQAGEIFSELLLYYTEKCLDEINNQLKSDNEKKIEIDKKKELEIKKLFLFFFIHYIDRRAHSLLNPENRKELMDQVGYMSIERFINTLPHNDNDQGTLLRNHLEELNAFVIKFNKYKRIIPSEGDSPKDTLFWEFSKEISQSIDNSTDITYILIANDLTSQVISALKIDEIVVQFK